jgi:hypothetical protein
VQKIIKISGKGNNRTRKGRGFFNEKSADSQPWPLVHFPARRNGV